MGQKKRPLTGLNPFLVQMGGGRQNKLSGVMRPEAQGDQLWVQVHVNSVLKLNRSVGWGQGAVLEWDSPHQAQ